MCRTFVFLFLPDSCLDQAALVEFFISLLTLKRYKWSDFPTVTRSTECSFCFEAACVSVATFVWLNLHIAGPSPTPDSK